MTIESKALNKLRRATTTSVFLSTCVLIVSPGNFFFEIQMDVYLSNGIYLGPQSFNVEDFFKNFRQCISFGNWSIACFIFGIPFLNKGGIFANLSLSGKAMRSRYSFTNCFTWDTIFLAASCKAHLFFQRDPKNFFSNFIFSNWNIL